MEIVLRERGLWKDGMTLDNSDPKMNMRHVLKQCPDFKYVPTILQEMSRERGHISVFLPRFHPELNCIELFWAPTKKLVKERTTNNIETLRKVRCFVFLVRAQMWIHYRIHFS